MIGTILSAIVVGAIIGALARLALPGRQGIGMVMTILLGITGSFLGSWITSQFGYSNAGGGFAILPFLVGVIAAAVLIGIYVAMAGRRGTTVR
ncbi:GlsB/YeaQ/YmgE family stress response membrane protein [Mycolicibacterium sp.]|uniref:GlsB/YeaQ/YmgE family stress response membrane protein n=1 Tax=Mycolicibacterium sp. TaxID=2320850 RepID=UPI0028AFDAB3|nr:GlsB/YeaQ/YmgE family stress response membrane protein [Mycolicibacterium sp.]